MLRAWLKSHLSRGALDAARRLRDELALQRVHRRGVRSARRYAGIRGLKLHLGCGANYKPGWVNIDLAPPADLCLDLREDLPFADGSAAIVYSEHVFEHLAYPRDAMHLLRESLRVLEPGCRFSVGVPDTAFALRSYVFAQEEFFRVTRERGWHPPWCDTPTHQINYHFRQADEHKYAYDYPTLERVLASAGFVRIHERPFDPTLDWEYRRWGTLYVDAYRPG